MVIMMKMSLEQHGARLIKDIKSLSQVDKTNNKFSDVQLKVGHRTFYCHKLVLQLNSDHLAQLSFTPETSITPENIEPDQLYDVLNFMYTGDITLTEDNIESVLKTADRLQMNDLKKLCFKFAEDHLIEKVPVQCWKLAMTHIETALALRCKENVVSNIKNLRSEAELLKLSEEMMKQILGADNLNVSSELEVCDMFMKWFSLQTGAGNEVHPEQFLSLIRWSGVSVTYIKSKLLQNITLTSNETCLTFLSKVVNYHLSGIQFEGLQTFHRTSTRIENCLVVFGLSNFGGIDKQVHRVSIQQMDSISEMTEISTEMQLESQACIHRSNVYITGIGTSKNEIWRLDTVSSTWFKCADMITGRRRHCAVTVDEVIYVLSGWVDDNSTLLSNIESYNIVRNEWSTAGDLIHAVDSAACVTYKNSIYIFFGRVSESNLLSHVQVYNPADQTCKVLHGSVPAVYKLMRAVLWETSVILMHRDTCLVYNFEKKTWLERKQFKTDVIHFGLVLDNQTIYIAGGGTCIEDKDKKVIWTCTDAIKTVSVLDIIEDHKHVVWKQHAKIPEPAKIQAYCILTLPTIIK